MKLRQIMLAILAGLSVTGPALAGEGAESTNAGRDYALSDGAGTTGPGMSGYLHQGMADHPVQSTSIHHRKKGLYRVSDGFSRCAVYNNNADVALQHIR